MKHFVKIISIYIHTYILYKYIHTYIHTVLEILSSGLYRQLEHVKYIKHLYALILTIAALQHRAYSIRMPSYGLGSAIFHLHILIRNNARRQVVEKLRKANTSDRLSQNKHLPNTAMFYVIAHNPDVPEDMGAEYVFRYVVGMMVILYSELNMLSGLLNITRDP